MSSSPAICPLCNQVSFAIAIPEVSTAINKRGQDPEHRAKISAGMKKLWQDPEYQAKMKAIRKKRWQDPEYRAKMRTARARRHNKIG
jgi:tripartite-type tricarboxylate transporter receptor subunit TctC